MLLETEKCFCPYCGEPIELVVDCSEELQSYVEDCFVCCRPMMVQVKVEDGLPRIMLFSEDEC